MCSALRNGDSHYLFQPRKQKKGHQEQEWLHLPEVLPTSQPLGFFLPDTKHRGRRGGSVPTQPPRAVHPPAMCQHATCVHVLCCGIGENNSHHTCTPTAETQSKNNNKVKAVAQSVLPSPSSLLYSKSIHTEMSCLGKK